MSNGLSLRWKLIGSYLLLIAAVLLSIVLLTRYSVRTIFVTYQQSLLQREGQLLATLIGADYSVHHDWTVVEPHFSDWTRLPRSEVWVVNSQGAPTLEQPPNQPAVDRPPMNRLRPALQGQAAKGLTAGFPDRPGQVWIAVPIRTGGSVIGAVYLATTPDANIGPRRGPPIAAVIQTAEDFVATVEQRVALTGLVVGACAILLGILLAKSITDPIHELRRAVGRIAAGDLAQRVRVRTHDEVGALAEDVNRMAARLEAHMAELHRQEALRRDLVANVSHDLATPLTGIQGFTEALLDNMVPGEEERSDIYNSIYREVQRLRRLVGDLQDLSKLESGMGQIQPQPLQVAELIEESLKVVGTEAQDRGVTLVRQAPNDLPLVWADGDRVTQVLLNLLDNALRYTPACGRITARARAVGQQVEIVIADTGSGIPEDELPQIFERFYRVDRSRSRDTGGGGLGLAIVKAIVTAHGGGVEAHSVLGEGTEMIFSLPILRPATAATKSDPARSKVLVGAK